MFIRPESLQSGHSDQILLCPCFGCCLSDWNADRREERESRAPNTEMQCSKSWLWVRFRGETLLAHLHENSKIQGRW